MPLIPQPLPFSETFAHPNDPLPVHLERVAARATASIAPTAGAEIRAIAHVAGLFHDLGKATPWFQTYLLRGGRRSPLTNHAELGALLVWWYSAALDWPLWQRLAVFIAVRRHHGALTFQTWPALLEQMRLALRENDHPLHKQLITLDLIGIQHWLITAPQPELAPSLEPLTAENVLARLQDRQVSGSKLRVAYQTLNEALATLGGFGALLAADKIDAALAGERIERQLLPINAVTIYQQQQTRKSYSSLNSHRDQIAITVTQTWLAHFNQHLFTLTAPTGAGKTLTILHAALQIRAQLEQHTGTAPRIIYCLPFTSIIDQNHTVFREVLQKNGIQDREDILLKHHHLTDALFRTDDTEYQADGAGQLLTETWQSEIVVTTFYQLLHTLFSPLNTNLKRAGQLTGALVLLDEVQAIPLRYWETVRQLCLAAAQTYGTRFVLLTATRPLIFQSGDAVELLPDHETHFRAMNRTRLMTHHHQPLSLDQFAAQLITTLRDECRATLIIVNRRQSVRTLFEQLQCALPERPIIALSTNLTPLDRRARIRFMQQLLQQSQPLIVITTQLIEAGVDVSFPIVHRELAPLDSIIQSAGRCNRNNENGAAGEVRLWHLQAIKANGDAGESLWRHVYDSNLIEVTTETLGHQTQYDEADFLQLSQRYFQGCRARQDQQRIDVQLQIGDFIGVEKAFQLTEELPTISVFICQNECDQQLWNQYQAVRNDDTLTPVQQQRRFSVFKRAFYERVIQVYWQASGELARNEVNYLAATPTTYTHQVGFIGFS
ncbi:CRISPR-associated helicase/endonuclease Cas3 [Chromatium weissei]|nr:CRISPR-associated helicase/endonuclease Cas3 [Chromatium weissei]